MIVSTNFATERVNGIMMSDTNRVPCALTLSGASAAVHVLISHRLTDHRFDPLLHWQKVKPGIKSLLSKPACLQRGCILAESHARNNSSYMFFDILALMPPSKAPEKATQREFINVSRSAYSCLQIITLMGIVIVLDHITNYKQSRIRTTSPSALSHLKTVHPIFHRTFRCQKIKSRRQIRKPRTHQHCRDPRSLSRDRRDVYLARSPARPSSFQALALAALSATTLDIH